MLELVDSLFQQLNEEFSFIKSLCTLVEYSFINNSHETQIESDKHNTK